MLCDIKNNYSEKITSKLIFSVCKKISEQGDDSLIFLF